MSDSGNPFSESASRSKLSGGARRALWTLAVAVGLLVAALITLALFTKQQWLARARAQARLGQAEQDSRAAQALAAARLEAINQLQQRVAELEREKAQVVRSARGLEDEMRAQLESKDVTISKLQGKLTVNILDRILFDSGEAVLKSDGEVVLRKIAAILAEHPELKIHVVGHTDNVPIRASARSRFASNWELSTARALAAVRFLTEQAGVDPHRLGAVGYGEFRPIADNATAEGRARNRRIAITILADELAGAEAAPANAGRTNVPVAEAASPPDEPRD